MPDRQDIERFVRLSAVSPDIAGAHPDLDIEKRYELYEKWFRLNPNSFLSLEKKARFGKWIPIGVSIILPLTNLGRELFTIGERSVLKLSLGDISPIDSSFDALLIDTLIVQDHYKGTTKGYGFPGLLLRHLAIFWSGCNARILIEPDSLKVEKKLQNDFRFKLVGGRETSEKLYEFNYPHDILGKSHEALYGKLIANINSSREWPLYQGGKLVGSPIS
jgi:hypothetical protein